MSIELKKCEECGMYLEPITTSEGTLLIHPPDKDCIVAEYSTCIGINISITDKTLWEEYKKKIKGHLAKYTVQELLTALVGVREDLVLLTCDANRVIEERNDLNTRLSDLKDETKTLWGSIKHWWKNRRKEK